ncbi:MULTISPECIES: heavy metal translocating P-type ATPase [unclassified Undibacterium]|uniref:heavy metal translocating P-type ATPase n=1 Tax=unclassified Undibacterium TaxID=2630295 RepID=UPI002AC97C79|nr:MULTISPECIES: heavy metal translocating P-type ATPase [unclassified Undibacterium]MEB0140276.1 heavy metal translocating P-type ATPase [Undibacterium sp. CCC2.1]MEB0173310.1 heavy metal translocating P-type ATPase [Undibacterium sp. CCC1.1]MEB0177129.1 heavy metal translocating P-type ATPase [Undibacterium sp. CCC3.4]MEB0216415.1 heavy metal translocating P-type ATPase [Undibacterium sp. 5I2]WPX45531.1 heavy metal translocating P-type ATPase [Undibacterium sp. CCC3.4]
MTEKTICCGHTHSQAVDTGAAHSHAHGHSHDHARTDEPGPARAATAIPAHAERLRLHISAMDCPTEEALIRRSLGSLPRVLGLDFDLLNRILTVHHEAQDVAEIHAKLHAIGMHGSVLGEHASAPVAAAPAHPYRRLAIGALAAAAAEISAWISGAETSWLVALLSISAILICGLPTLKKGWIALRHFTLNIHLLMTAAVIGACAIGQWPEAAMVICLFAVAETLEAASLSRARDAISGLLDQTPETALVAQADGSWLAQATEHIALGALLLCRPGDRIALDGVIEDGRSSVNQAAITGESMPVEKNRGDTVYAGSLNQTGALQIRVSAAAGATMLARIAHSVQEAQSQRAPMQSFVDRFASIYTPLVFVIALLTAILPPLLLGHNWHDSLYQALVLLVIACPCALVISTPVTVVSGLALAARRGIVVKGGLFLEQGRLLKHLAFDKTGTLTEGKPRLSRSISLSSLSQAEVLQLAASLDANSSHPLALALLEACPTALTAVTHASLFEQGRGRGVQGVIEGLSYQLGNRAMLAALSASASDMPALEATATGLEAQGNSVIFLCCDGKVLGILAIADQVRTSTRSAIDALHKLGISSLMLTGDNDASAQAISQQAGIRDVRSQLLPEDKLTAIAALAEQGVTGMIGDGINDAPALARAHIGFAMAAGSDTALETADVALMQNDLRKLPEFISISRQTHAVLWQNISFALAVKLLFFVLAFSGHASLWMAVFADTGTSLLVVLNGVRLLTYAAKLESAAA